MEEFKPWGMELKSYLLLMHLSQFAGYIIPLGGLIMPIVMWATNKDQSKEIDNHGKVILNWIISAMIYAVICLILSIVVIGIFGFIILGICGLIFAIIGAVKANEGTLWHYPLSIKFFKVDA